MQFVAEDAEFVSVVTVQAVACAEPEKSVGILSDRHHGHLRKAVGYREMFETEFLRRLRIGAGQRQQGRDAGEGVFYAGEMLHGSNIHINRYVPSG